MATLPAHYEESSSARRAFAKRSIVPRHEMPYDLPNHETFPRRPACVATGLTGPLFSGITGVRDHPGVKVAIGGIRSSLAGKRGS